jgi:hypothetical protein
MRFIFWSLFTLTLLIGSTTAYAQDEKGTNLKIVSMTSDPYWMINYEWSIAHNAEPNSWEMWRGDRGRSLFTIAANRSDGYAAAWVQGEICVVNQGNNVTEDLLVKVWLQMGDVVVSETVAQNGSQPVLSPKEEGCLRYRLEVPNEHLNPTAEYLVAAHAGAQNTKPHKSSEMKVSVQIPSEPVTQNEKVKIAVPGGGTWELSGSAQLQYEQTFTCDSAQGVQTRTAKILETEQAAVAEVNISCYALDTWPVLKTYLNRLYRWGIELDADVQSLILLPGESVPVTYQVNVNQQSYTDLFFRAQGTIYTRNRTPFPAVITSLDANFSKGSQGKINCGKIQFPYRLNPGEMISCSYSGSPAEGELITAAVSLKNTNYHHAQTAAEAGITRFESTPRLISYQNPHAIYPSYECVQVSGLSNSKTETVCLNGTTQTSSFMYTKTIGPFDRCGAYSVDETAQIFPKGISQQALDTWQVKIQVPCDKGCTRNPGYWLTYSGLRVGLYDPTWDTFKGVQFYKSAKTWDAILFTNTISNPYYLLARQFVAARLNIVKGATTTREINQAIQNAEIVFEKYTPAEIGRAKVNLQREIQNLARDLDHYNRGLTGPGTCTGYTALPRR